MELSWKCMQNVIFLLIRHFLCFAQKTEDYFVNIVNKSNLPYLVLRQIFFQIKIWFV